MDSPIGLFRANITPLDRVLKITVGRKEMLEDLVENLERQAGKKGGQHYLFIGPRGIGKTHFLTLIENAVKTKRNLKKRYTVIRFPEENNRLLSFADILLGITEILGEVTNDDSWRELHQSASENERDEDIIDTILPRLKGYREKTGQTLLIFLENLDTLLTEQIKQEQDIHRLRSFLMDSPCAALIGTSPVYFPSLYNQKSPLYEFFDIQVLEDLTEEQTLEMIRKNLEWENCRPVLESFESLTPKIQAIHEMTGGNLRLIMMLYELIAHDNLQDVQMQLQKLLDQISPFYQDRLKDLAPQERALLEVLALQRSEPRTPANIAKHLRKSPQQISSLLQRMTKAGYLTASDNPQDKRSRIYRIKEGFFDLWLAISESRVQRKRLVYLVEFFEAYFNDRGERERKRRELWQKLETEKEAFKGKKNNAEMLEYLSDLGDNKERSQAKLALALYKLKEGQAPEAAPFLREVESIAPRNLTFMWMREQADRWATDGLEVNIRQWLDEMIDYWRTQRSGDFEKAVEIAHKLGQDLSDRGLHKIRIELLTDALSHSTNPQQKCSLLLDMAHSQKMDGQLDAARVSLEQALEIYRETGDRAGEGTTLNNIGYIYSARGENAMALDYLQKSLKIYREIGNRQGEGTTLNNISLISFAHGEYVTALDFLQKSLEIRREIGDRAGMIMTLHNMAQIHLKNKQVKEALDEFTEALRLARETNSAKELFNVSRDFGRLLFRTGRKKEGIPLLRQALDVGKAMGLPDISEIEKLLEEYEKGNPKPIKRR